MPRQGFVLRSYAPGIHYKFKMVFGIPQYFDQAQLTSYSWDFLLTSFLVRKPGTQYS